MGRRDARTQAFDGVAFFEGCDQRLLTDLAPHADRVRVPAGRVLAVAGRHAWQLLVLLEGTAEAVEQDQTGVLVAGQAIAPDAAAVIAPYRATVTARSEVEVLVVHGAAFAWAVRHHPALADPVRPQPVIAATTTPATASMASTASSGASRSPDRVLAPRRRPGASAARSLLGATRARRRVATVHDRNTNIIAGAGR